ncbi:MAG: alpha/beta fold hydrolase [Sphingomonadaceae bacterium]
MRLFLAMAIAVLLAGCMGATGAVASKISYSYGGNPRQILDIHVPKGARHAPLILFVHGGGWSEGAKEMGQGGPPAHFTAQGYAFAALNYRLVPDATVEDQAADVARALSFLLRNARALGLDGERVILIGHSSGAHLAALVATDPQWLQQANVADDVVRGVISLDGAGIDVPGIMAAGASRSPFYTNAFGPDAARQGRLSPLEHLGAGDAPNWLLLYDGEHNPGAGYFAERFAVAARAGGMHADAIAITGTGHMRMLQELGRPGDQTTAEIDRFIDRVIGKGAQ